MFFALILYILSCFPQLLQKQLTHVTLHLAVLIVNVAHLMGMPFAHASISVLVHHLIVDLNVSLVLNVGRIGHVLIKSAKIRVKECAELMHSAKS